MFWCLCFWRKMFIRLTIVFMCSFVMFVLLRYFIGFISKTSSLIFWYALLICMFCLVVVKKMCSLCMWGLNSEQESHQHLFFKCSYSTEIWSHFCRGFTTAPLAVSRLLVQPQLSSSSGFCTFAKLLMKVIVYFLAGVELSDIPGVFFPCFCDCSWSRPRDRLLSSPAPLHCCRFSFSFPFPLSLPFSLNVFFLHVISG